MRSLLRRLSPFLVISLFVAALWLPFGLKTTGLMEEWLSYNNYERPAPTDRNEDANFLTLSGDQRLRPLQDTSAAFAHLLTPDSFVGLNLVQIVSIIVKGMALYLLLTKLMPRQRFFALTAALLLVVFPADQGIFTFRGVHIHGAVALYLFAVYFMLRAWDRLRLPTVLMMVASAVASIFIYEIGYPLVMLTPLLLLIKLGEPEFRKRFVRLGLIWYAAPILTLLYTALTLGTGPTYQSWVIQHSGINQTSVLGEMAQAVVNAYVQHFAGGWLDALRLIGANARFMLLAALLTLTALGVGWRLAREDGETALRRFLWLIVIGLAAVFLGYSLFLLTPYRELKWRVFLYSSIGGAICVASLCYLLSRRSRLLYAVLSGVLLFVATVGALHQQQYYVSLSQNEQTLLQGVIAQVPQPDPSVPVVVVDETGHYHDNWSLGASYLLTSSLQYIYQNYTLQFVLCSYGADGHFAVLPELLEQCQFGASGVTLDQSGQPVAIYPYDQMIILRHTDAATTLLTAIPANYLPANVAAADYDPAKWLNRNATLPHRFATIFSMPTPKQ